MRDRPFNLLDLTDRRLTPRIEPYLMTRYRETRAQAHDAVLMGMRYGLHAEFPYPTPYRHRMDEPRPWENGFIVTLHRYMTSSARRNRRRAR